MIRTLGPLELSTKEVKAMVRVADSDETGEVMQHSCMDVLLEHA